MIDPSEVHFADPGQLAEVIRTAASQLHSARYRLVVALAAYDRTGHWAFSGATTCANWVAGMLAVSTGTAREWLRIGHALESLPSVSAAMADGRLSYCAVRTLSRVAVDHVEHEAELVELAERSRPGELARNLARWAIGHDEEGDRDRRDRRDTYMTMRVDADGMGVINAKVPAMTLGRIQAVIDARVMQTKHADGAAPGDRSEHAAGTGPGGAPAGQLGSAERTSLGFQRAHAMAEVLTGTGINTGIGTGIDGALLDGALLDGALLDGAVVGESIRDSDLGSRADRHPVVPPYTAGGARRDIKVDTEVIVHVRGDGCTLHDGTPISDSVVASQIEGSLIRVLIHDAENNPVNASTCRRHPTTRQKRVVDERHPVCVDCGGVELLEYDHQPEWRITRRTHTDELTRRCPRCHDRRHRELDDMRRLRDRGDP